MRKLSVEDIDNIIELYVSGMSSRKVAAIYNVDPSLILLYLKKRNVPSRKNNKLLDDEVEEIIKMYDSGTSIKQISKHYNVTDVTIGNYLKRNGIQIRTDHRDDLDVEILIEMYNSGMSMRSIATHFGTDHGTISRRIRNKIEIRDNFYYYINGDIDSNHTAKPRICVNCGKEFLLRDENGRAVPRYKTCSDECLHEYLSSFQTNENAHSWKGGRSQGYYQKQSRKHKEMICENCGETNVRLDVHHIDKNKSNNSPENIMILCVSCHAKLHYENGDSGLQGAP